MNLEKIEEKIKDKLEPHMKALSIGECTEYDFLPALFSIILNNQNLLKNRQDESYCTLNELSKIINDLKLSQLELIESKFSEINKLGESNHEEILKNTISVYELAERNLSELEVKQNSSFQEVLNSSDANNKIVSDLLKTQLLFENSLIAVKEEISTIKKIAAFILLFSILAMGILIYILFIFMK